MRVFWYSGHAATRQALAAYLSQQGYLVRCAETPEIPLDGEELILLDLPPVPDAALVLVREFRRRANDRIPIVALGVWTLPGDVEPILDSGADDYVLFPCPLEGVAVRLAIVAQMVRKHSVGAEQKRLEERLAQTSKTESIATLAGSLAHDFNNLLAAILGNAELALIDVSPNSPIRYSLEQIDKTSRRAAELARQMLTFSGRGCNGTEFVGVNLNELVQEMAELLRISIPKNCVIRYYFTRPLPLIWADPSQLRQVVMNLLLNAAEAMNGQGGTIFVRTGVIESENIPSKLTLEVRDTGAGMTPDVRARIFDPFFTTKRAGRGLGLAAVRGIVQAHKSRIEVESEPGHGSTFRILFPVFQGIAAATKHSCDLDLDWHGTGNVLLIEDEDAVRDAARRLLAKAGYTVLEARGGREGIDTIRRFGGVIHAVVVDINIPGVDGVEVYQAVRAARPDIRLLIWCGFDPDGVRERLKSAGSDVAVIEKPSQSHELALALKRLLAPQDPGEQNLN
jgi:signal transduction histidine kinase/ActR/RegA family two-component response regulator